MLKKSYSGTPEEYFTIPKTKELDTDAIHCALARAQSVGFFLYSHFEGDNTQYNNEIMTNACWNLQGLLEQIEILMKARL